MGELKRKGNERCPYKNCNKLLHSSGQTFCGVPCFNLHNGKEADAMYVIEEGDKFE